MASGKRKRKSHPAAPLLPADVGDDDIEISDEDVSFVAKNFQYAGFLSSLDTHSITKQILGINSNKKMADNLELYYEKRAKFASKGKEVLDTDSAIVSDVLPVKSLSGELQYRKFNTSSATEKEAHSGLKEQKPLVELKKPSALDDHQMKSDLTHGQGDNVTVASLGHKKLSKLELRKERKKAKKETQALSKGDTQVNKSSSHLLALEQLEQDLSEEKRIEEIKAQMAELGTAVLADPENNLDSLTELQGLCSYRDSHVSSMAMLSLLAIYRDIVPGYRIRLPTEKELEMKVSKEVKQLRDFESKLLKCYQRYIQFLVKSTKSGSLSKAATRCITGLLEAIPHFNFRDSLLSATVPMMNSADSDCRKLSCNAIQSLFLNEGKHGGSATVEAVEMIAELVKTENCMLRPDVIEVLLSLAFDEDLNRHSEQAQEGGQDRRVEKLQKKHVEKRKKAKHELAAQLREEVVTDFREASAMPDAAELHKLQTQTLTAVFETYFRILKASINSPDSSLGSSSASFRAKLVEYGPRPMLGPCLNGLAKFSHLVSVEFMGDLLSLLKRLAGGEIKGGTPLSFRDRLHCCVVAFKIVRNNLEALNIDLRDFFVALYNLILCHKTSRDDSDGLVLAEGLQVMLWETRQHDMQRVAAFIKRLAAKSLHLGPGEAISALVTIQHLLQRYKRCQILLENEDGGSAAGHLCDMQEEEGADPDLSGALSSVLWELSLLSRHYHPAVSRLATQISSIATSNEAVKATLNPTEAILLYSSNNGGFNPSVQLPKKKVKRRFYPAYSVKEVDVHESIRECSEMEARQMFRSHFQVLRDIKENEALRKQLNKIIYTLNLFKAKKMPKHRKNRSPMLL
ncbi:hypothetical protein KP509_14G058300 [Ceratopteris richardii]|uniref:Nucleolar complex protein 3 homolog n=1 Tax=Ceratopteris richardii TaxID=49495 RepID=A0A8T2T8A1_CERRI|nr:hypothetical protein KP509_14G058300 [Ceratopteris richardii]KAH7415726.1 hypothetical protein KP509_14G058300 [Ceratopteris richardii]